MFNVNNTYIRISGCIINVPLNQEGKIESKKYWEFNISIPANTSTGSPKPWNWNLKFSNLQGQNFFNI